MATGRRNEGRIKRRNPLPNFGDLAGAVCVQWRNSGGKLRPYYYRFWRENGRLRKQYVKLAEVQRVRAACENNRLTRRAWRAEINAARRQYRSIIESLKREVLGL